MVGLLPSEASLPSHQEYRHGDRRRWVEVRAQIRFRWDHGAQERECRVTAAAKWAAVLLFSLDTQVEPPFAIKVNVDLVVLHATVRDRAGHTPMNLREEDFRVFEDGARQSIRLFRHEDTPVTVGLVIDHSGSMRNKLREVVTAARTFVEFSSPADEMFVVNFNEQATLGLSGPVRFTNNQDELARAIQQTAATGQTALYDAIALALRQMKQASRDQHVLILISDGADNASKLNLTKIARMALESNAIVYAIGIFDETDPDRNPAVLRRLARDTGGDAFMPKRLQDVAAICQQIAGDIRRRYTIGYVSTNASVAPGLRHVRMTAESSEHKKLTVHTRIGYLYGGTQ